MNKSSLSKILGKNGLTGAELGRLAILNNVEIIKNYNAQNGKGAFFSKDEIDRTARNLTDYQKTVYGNYLDMHAVLNNYFNLGNTMYQQAMHGFYYILLDITSLLSGLYSEVHRRELPLIVTEDKYKEIKTRSEEEVKNFGECYIELFVEALDYYVKQYDKNPEADTLLKQYIDKHKDQPIKNKKLMTAYIEDNLKHYYIGSNTCFYMFSDGTSSQGHTLAEYIEDFINRPLIKGLEEKFLNEIEYIRREEVNLVNTFNPYTSAKEKADLEDFIANDKEATASRIDTFLIDLKNFFKGAGEEDIAEKINKLQEETLIIPEEAYPKQEDLIKYWAFINMPYVKDQDNIDLFMLYKEELPDIVDIIDKDLRSHKVIKDALKGITEKDLCKRLIGWETLAKADIYTYKQRAEDHLTALYPEAQNGFCIIQDNSISEDKIKEGIYTPNIQGLNSKLFEMDLTNEHIIKATQGLKKLFEKLLIPSLKNLCAINLFYEDIQEIYEIDGLKDAYGQKLDVIMQKITSINTFKELILLNLRKVYNEDEYIKLAYHIKQALKYIDMADIMPDEEQRKHAKEVVGDVKNFNGYDFSPKFLYLYINGTPDTINIVNENNN